MQVVTANRLIDGAVVFLAKDDAWSEVVSAARVAAEKKEAAALLATAERAASDCVVVGPYLIEVAMTAAGLQPVRLRERIRANGPTPHPELGKQADRTRPAGTGQR